MRSIPKPWTVQSYICALPRMKRTIDRIAAHSFDKPKYQDGFAAGLRSASGVGSYISLASVCPMSHLPVSYLDSTVREPRHDNARSFGGCVDFDYCRPSRRVRRRDDSLRTPVPLHKRNDFMSGVADCCDANVRCRTHGRTILPGCRALSLPASLICASRAAFMASPSVAPGVSLPCVLSVRHVPCGFILSRLVRTNCSTRNVRNETSAITRMMRVGTM